MQSQISNYTLQPLPLQVHQYPLLQTKVGHKVIQPIVQPVIQSLPSEYETQYYRTTPQKNQHLEQQQQREQHPYQNQGFYSNDHYPLIGSTGSSTNTPYSVFQAQPVNEKYHQSNYPSMIHHPVSKYANSFNQTISTPTKRPNTYSYNNGYNINSTLGSWRSSPRRNNFAEDYNNGNQTTDYNYTRSRSNLNSTGHNSRGGYN